VRDHFFLFFQRQEIHNLKPNPERGGKKKEKKGKEILTKKERKKKVPSGG
jgi:hypothetical protein